MKKVQKIFVTIILIAIVGTVMFFIGKQIGLNTDKSSTSTTIEEVTVGNQTIKKTITSSGEIKSTSTEKLSLETTKYFETMCVENDDTVKAGENILKYTNGTYLTAPYDCVVTEINIPENSKKCTNEHYIQISSNNNLTVQFKVDETKINNVKLGQEANIKFSAYDEKTISGVVTNISSTATNGKFTVTVEFENDGEVRIGMTATVTLK